MQIFAEEVPGVDFEDFGCNRSDEFGDEVNRSSWCSSRSSSSSSPCHFSPWMLDESLCSKTFSYELLTVEPVRLVVLKLDGSSFDIIVTRKATIRDLKQAVEDEFSQLSEHKVSWSHLWAQFCLCFKDQKLLDDRDSIEVYGIQDDDQLRFIRHTSTTKNLGRQRSETQDSESEEPDKSSIKPVTNDDTQKNGGNKKKDVGVTIEYRSRWLNAVRRYFSYRNLDVPDADYRALSTSSRSNSAGGSPDVFQDMTITSYHDRL